MTFGKVLLFFIVFSLFLVPSFAFAGGGPLGLEAWPLRPFEQTKTFIIAARLYVPNCDTITVQAKFENQLDGDSVTPFTPPDDGSYYEPHYFTQTNTWEKICMRYFKATSSIAKQRTIQAQATIDGTVQRADYDAAFGSDEYSKQLQDFDRYNNMPQVDVLSQKSLGGSKREVQMQWNKVEGVQKYAVYAREITTTSQQSEVAPFGSPLTTTSDNKATINLASDMDFNLSVVACTPNSCTPPDNPYELLLSSIQTGTTVYSQSSNPPVITPVSNPNAEKMETLNKKVAELEHKLNESNKKQNILEEKINQLLNFIKSLFPNFT
jgi:hypothetical protein